MILFLLLVTLWLLIQLPPVQTWLVGQVTGKLSRNLHTTIRVKHVDFALFNKMVLEGTLVEDQKHDTILYAGAVKVNITDWWFVKDKAELQYIGLENATIKLHRVDSIWNYQFIADYFASPTTSTATHPKKDSTKTLELDLKKVELQQIHFLKRDEWRGEDMDLALRTLDLDAKEFSFTKKVARIDQLIIGQPEFTLTNYQGRRPYPPDTTEHIVNDPLHLRLNAAGWDLTAQKVEIRNGMFRNEKPADTHPNKYFDGDHIKFYAIHTTFNNLRLNRDTITAQFQLSTKERSGFEVKKLNARIKWYPEAMEFAHLDLQTGKSHLRNYFAMRFRTIDDMSDFETRIHMDADFSDADIESDDIAYFAPELQDWKTKIRITGNLNGTVNNLSGKNVVVKAGQDSYLNGNIHLRGLPEIDTTHIDFQSNDFRTTYKDVATFVPSVKTIEQPRLDRIEWLRFKGSFIGKIRDFVTNGRIETNLGALNTNVNMQLLEYAPSVYSGNISTENFQLGSFLDNDNIGNISFEGKVIGAGLRSSTLNATLDGTINSLDFNQYTYKHILVNGAIAKKKFNGELIAGDAALDARLNGLIDFSEERPHFDFEAEVAKADLFSLHFVNQPVEVNGKFRCKFTGDNIDNFLGTASIYDASIYKGGQRVSFDSLAVESSIVDNNKTITVVSNEFDGAIVGEFSIHDLPASFQTFLNKYYPAYIAPAKTIPTNQNFSFVITTKKVDEYVDLFNKDLKGFNNAGISGRINTRENLLDLNVDLPGFSYKNIAFENVALKGRGNLDSLAIETSISDIRLNDSLHFPSTLLHLKSSNNLSQVQLTTSASQTITTASIAAQVQTLTTGVKIRFDPSTFEVNGKNWTIDPGGEMAFGNNTISADGLTFHSGDQQIRITTTPSDIGSWNDVHLSLKKINIGDFTPYLVKSERFEGLLSGSADITDPLGKPQVEFQGESEQFRFNNDSIGRIQLEANYHRSNGMLNATAHSDNKDYHFDITSKINTLDSAAANPIDISTDIANTKVDILEKYLGGIFTNLTGYASGHLQVVGPAAHLQYLGTVNLKDASLKVAYTQCTYKIPTATINFKKDTIDFGTLQLKDRMGHTADLLRGRLFHHAFDDLGFDFEMNTNRLLLLDTKATDNSQFYGTVIGKARMTLTGPEEAMRMYIKGEPVDSSNIYLPPSVSRESGDADFITWKVYGKEMKNLGGDRKSANLLVTLDMNANNYANIYVLLDPLTGDIIKANGHGLLTMRVGTTDDLTLNGTYEIDHGSYNFTFQSFIHKPFDLKPGVGHYIRWNGNPYDADINIEATYTAPNIRFSDLGLSNASGVVLSESVKRVPTDIIVTANLQGKLMSPNISFQIDMAQGSTLRNDQDALALLQRIQNDPNELNKQVSTLVVLNTFVPLSSTTNTFNTSTAVTSVVVNSISGALSNAFSKQVYSILQKVFNDKTLTVNFNTNFYNGSSYLTDQYDQTGTLDRTNLKFSIVKSIMNEKLTFTVGSAFDFGMSAQQAQASSFQFLPNIAAEYKITPDGRVALTFFYRDSYNYLSSANHTQNSSGASISYRRDFDRIDELFKKKKKTTPAVKKNKKAKSPTATPSDTTSKK